MDIHSDLLPTVMQRAKSAKIGYQIGQIGMLATISNSNLFAHTPSFASEHVTNTNSFMMLAVAGLAWLGLRTAASIHVAWRETCWGYSASSLQKIYKNRRANYDAQGRLKCINCHLPLEEAETQASGRNDAFGQRVSHLPGQCSHCQFKLWPGTTRLSALLKNLDSSL
ncbi:hypothetical protein V8Z74_24545 [Comamonas sp. w2-DMI]|uniref:hypothetical protein n=1 Tax=Comamonas sp. w2-DMI TaxID=3126391 RepID=UPI0032E4A37E